MQTPSHHKTTACSFIPPYITQEISQRGSPEQREWALRTMVVTERLRGQRDVLGSLRISAPTGLKRRTIYDAEHGYELPGTLVRDEGDPSSKDPAVNEAYSGSGSTYDFYWGAFHRNSVDNAGLRLDSTVHYGQNYDNAFWNGAQMVYGDGDGQIFNGFTKALDVIGHELTHGVIDREARLIYRDEPGALNESFSDVFGLLVKQYVANEAASDSSWIIGEGLFTKSIHGTGIRSMKAPGTAYDDPVIGRDPQPAHVKDMYHGTDDNGGVHINSGIPNHAFYMAAVEIGGFAWENAGKIWYVALTERLRSLANFKDAADVTLAVAGKIYGNGSREQKAVRSGWRMVGVLSS
jgi:Zn-dependent metalloprotease